ncbi:MAG: F0F1 ATP synthase subunit epsilon [Phycisphaerales bacterium]|nr:F0F1 ATP synthase subunit epsilon [Phycisphaerales bacterium]
MSTTFRCAVMTPSGASFDGDVNYASFPAWDGQYGVMAGMSPLLGQLGIGPLRLDTAEGTRWFAVEEGFAHVRDNTLTILSESVVSVDDLSVAELEAELRAFDASEHPDLSADERTKRRAGLSARHQLVQHHRSDRNT